VERQLRRGCVRRRVGRRGVVVLGLHVQVATGVTSQACPLPYQRCHIVCSGSLSGWKKSWPGALSESPAGWL
jgi:hypothetical protein